MADNNKLIIDKNNLKSDSFDRIDVKIDELGLGKKDRLHVRLLAEETLGMLKAMTGDYDAVIWFEKPAENQASINLTVKAEDIDINQKHNLIDVSTEKTNASAKGFMGKVADIIENGLLNYDNVMKLQQEYGGGYVDYGTMGISGTVDGIGDSPFAWTLDDYRTSLEYAVGRDEAAKEAWDELEKSIVANLAKDVTVGVHKNVVDMTIICELQKN